MYIKDMVMVRRLLNVLILAILFTGCSGDPYDKYLGLWERQDDDNINEVIEIVKDGETFLIDDNVLSDTNIFGGKKEPRVLAKSDGQLLLSTGFGAFQFALSKDNNILRANDRSYKRIDVTRVTEIKSILENARLERERNRVACKELRKKYQIEKDIIRKGDDPHKLKKNKYHELIEAYSIKEKVIPRCNARLY